MANTSGRKGRTAVLARDVMKRDVVTIGPEDSVGDAAALMYKRGISGLPVVKDGKVIGMLSEGDLIRRQEIGSDRPHHSWWLALFGNEDLARTYVRSHAKRVADVMTADLLTVGETASVAEIADIFAAHHVKRVPVLRDGKLVGLVSRANLIQALAGASQHEAGSIAASDDTIRAALLGELQRQPWWDDWLNNVVVSNGVVDLWGFFEAESDKAAARVAAENTPGVMAVHDHRMRRTAAMTIS